MDWGLGLPRLKHVIYVISEFALLFLIIHVVMCSGGMGWCQKSGDRSAYYKDSVPKSGDLVSIYEISMYLYTLYIQSTMISICTYNWVLLANLIIGILPITKDGISWCQWSFDNVDHVWRWPIWMRMWASKPINFGGFTQIHWRIRLMLHHRGCFLNVWHTFSENSLAIGSKVPLGLPKSQ